MFVVIESIDGGGKGKQREEVEKYFLQKEVTVASKEFPDHDTSLWNDYLHPALHGEKSLNAGAWFTGFLFEKFLWSDELKKYKGDKNNIFIADGYFTTMLVYQCKIQGKPTTEFALKVAKEFSLTRPDLVVYLDVNPKVAMHRKLKEEGKAEKDLFESDIEKQKEIKKAFKELASDNVWANWVELDGNGSIPEVRDLIIAEINKLY